MPGLQLALPGHAGYNLVAGRLELGLPGGGGAALPRWPLRKSRQTTFLGLEMDHGRPRSKRALGRASEVLSLGRNLRTNDLGAPIPAYAGPSGGRELQGGLVLGPARGQREYTGYGAELAAAVLKGPHDEARSMDQLDPRTGCGEPESGVWMQGSELQIHADDTLPNEQSSLAGRYRYTCGTEHAHTGASREVELE